ncbi:MAG: 5-(carboxyamino)imidazole ribonucleotide synthase [Trueperaceae bacterium]
MNPILPGATIGVLGGGQLGRMLAQVAGRMGYRTVVFSPSSGSPAGQVADLEIVAEYQDGQALASFAERVDVVTIEFENIPIKALEVLESIVPVRPGPRALFTTQNRAREKEFLIANGIPHADSVHLAGPHDLLPALERLGAPAVLKTAGFGYDGKGQLLLRGPDDNDAALAQLRSGAGVLERFVEFRREISVVLARSPSGETRVCPPIENRHRSHILDVSRAPADCSTTAARQALDIADAIADALDAVGVVCVEFFETNTGELLVNEIAPRPHNSGHLTIEACAASQFEQQLRAICGLPLGDFRFLVPAAMANLLGDMWEQGEPDWPALLAGESVALHLYGKEEARPGRKMGHITAVAESPAAAVRAVEAARVAAGGPRAARR